MKYKKSSNSFPKRWKHGIVMYMFRKRTGVLLLICVGLLLYFNSLTNAFLGDDRSQILNNLQVHSLSSLPSFFFGSTYYNGGLSKLTGLYYRPIMLSAYTLVYTMFGPDPLPFHVLQLSIHIANAILVFFLFGLFFNDGLAFLLGILFLILPINNEAVVYIANLQDVLFVLFGLMAIVLVITRRGKHIDWKTSLLTGILLLLSLFTKETGVAIIGIILLYGLIFMKRISKYIAFPLIGSFLVYVFFRYFLAHIGITKNQAVAPIATAPVLERLITLPAIIATYIKTFFFPLQLSSSHYWIVTSITSPDFYVSLLIDSIFFISIFLAWRWIKRKHKKYATQFLFFFGWFVVVLLPHMQLIPLDTTIAERWFYLAGIGILGMIGTAFQCIRIKEQSTYRIVYAAIALVVVLLSIRTFLRNFDWQDGVTLYAHDIKVTKPSFLLDNALATELLIAGNYEQAKPYVFSSIRQYPFYANLNNAAIISLHENNVPQTKKYLQEALLHAGNYAVYENYANFLLAYYTPTETVTFAKSALQQYPNDPKILYDFGKAEYLLGDKRTALTALRKSYVLLSNKRTKTLIEEIEKQQQ